MLRADSINRLSFDLSVIGTAANPASVRCVLGSNPTASFDARRGNGDAWVCDIDLPLFLEASEIPFKIEVLINGRLFTPLSTTLKVDRTPKIESQVHEPEVEETEVPEPVQVAVPPEVVPEEAPAPVVPEPVKTPEPVVETKEDEKKKVAEALAKIFETTPVVNTPPKKTGSMFAQIDEMAGPAKVAPPPAPALKIKPKRRVSIPESRPSKVVVHVTKGPVVYK